ncbi:protein RarD [Aphanomyces astaci]|uniref:Protein RarD n=2 Tax=Aphanomyces astaci TaxID=112090 RepID=W4G6W6_APHAT|nr:protein RarD [Aphanomyces astaci]ETV75026.1 protein RarD [Aphanomyces astaci]|eukprot:XP_009835530.1 protein RarD [Aphanomyces astaci]
MCAQESICDDWFLPPTIMPIHYSNWLDQHNSAMISPHTVGMASAASAFTIFGLYPLYFKQLNHIPPLQVALHRVVWSFVVLVPLFLWQSNLKHFTTTAFTRNTLGHHALSAAFLAGTWVLYVFGVSGGYLVEISLGFFVNPVLSVVLAVVVLKEPLRQAQWVAVGVAMSGVLVVAIAIGSFPSLGLGIGTCLALYGLMKKTSPIGSVDGIVLEIGVLVVPSVVGLVAFELQGTGAFLHTPEYAADDWLLIGSGVATVVPLLLFASAAQKISFTLLGLLQYIGPMLTFALGVFVYHEAFSTAKLAGFAFVWIALAVFAVESLVTSRNERRKASIVTLATSEEIHSTTTAEVFVVDWSQGPTTPVDASFKVILVDKEDDRNIGSYVTRNSPSYYYSINRLKIAIY